MKPFQRAESESDGSSSSALDLAILTVCVERNYDDLRRNIALIDRLNPGVAWRLVIIDNSTGKDASFTVDDPRVEIRPGVPLDPTKPEDVRYSYHHAEALNQNVDDLGCRLLLIADPDLFVIYPNWMRDVTQYVLQKRLRFFGVPWHPRWYTKYRNFPCVHFMLIDLQQVPVDRLDFRPELVERPSWSKRRQSADRESGIPAHPGNSNIRTALMATARKLGWRVLSAVYRAGYPIFSRHLVGSSHDTGWKIWNDFGRSARVRSEVVLPVVDRDADFTAPSFLTTKMGRLLEALLPARFRFLPRRETFIDPANATGFDTADFWLLAAEMFVWRGRPFAFHLRRHMTDQLKSPPAQDAEAAVLSRILEGVGSPHRT